MQNRVINFTSKASSQIIYHSKKLSWYIWLLILGKVFHCAGIFVAYDVIKKVQVVNLIWLISLICSCLFGVAQHPISEKKKLKFGTWCKIVKLSLLHIVLLVLLFYGLSQVGPYRTALLIEHNDVVILAVYGAIFKGKGGPGKLRGSLWFVLGILSLILFDNDSSFKSEHPEGQQHNGIKHFIFHILSWMGLSDHEGGILILLLVTILTTSLSLQSQQLSVEVGGSKKLNALIWIASTCILSPLTFTLFIFKVSALMDTISVILPVTFIAFCYFVLHYYINFPCIQRLTSIKVARIGTLASFVITSLLFLLLWPVNISPFPDTSEENEHYHKLSGGAVFSLLMFSIATLQLTSTKDFIGIDDSSLLPFHDISSNAISKSQSLLTFLISTLQTILADRNSRTIFYFLCINLGFTFVELLYGAWTNSLGLISDGFHMLFDCSALVMGLCASVMAQWKPSKQFPFGYGRIEVLSGFVNGLFLSVIGSMVFIEAIERMFEPPQIHTEKLLTVAVCGLVVNLCGIFAFSSNGHHGHSHGVPHSHNHKEHGHHGSHTQAHSHNANMEGVFLHIVADTLGSVAVIVSSILIDWYGWLIADPICSLILSVLILASVFPLLKNSAAILLLSVPPSIKQGSKDIINKVLELDSVISCQNPHMWQHCDNLTVATMQVNVSGDVPEQKIIQQVTSILQESGYSQITVQIEVVKSHTSYSKIPPTMWGLGTVVKSLPKLRNEMIYSLSEV